MLGFRLFNFVFLQFLVSRCVVNAILNGDGVYSNQFPSFVSLYVQNYTFIRRCNGFLACNNVIVTTAYCVADMTQVAVFPYLQQNNNWNSEAEVDSFNRTGQFIKTAVNVKKEHIHPKCDTVINNTAYNVAVVVLDCDVSKSEYTDYATVCECGEPKDDVLLTVAGFGRVSPDTSIRYPSRLQKATMQKITDARCVDIKPEYYSDVSDRDDYYCVFQPDGLNDTLCVGDGGAPAYQTCRGHQTAV